MSGDAIEGRVVEEESCKPIEGVIVVVKWEGYISALVDSQRVCVYVQTTTTDKNGYYKFPAWKKSSEMGHVQKIKPDITVYKTGYQWPDRILGKYNEYYLTPAKGMREDRLAHLMRMSRVTTCSNAGRSKKNRYLLLNTLYEEAKGIAVNDKEKEIVDYLEYGAEFSLVDESKPMKRDENGQYINIDPKDNLK